jgi:hypothetical protein
MKARSTVSVSGMGPGGTAPVAWRSPSSSTGGAPDAERCPDDDAKLQKLKARDAEVRAHEAAHAGAAGAHGGGASFDYEVGPDGKQYAIGGEVPVQLQKGRTPDETIRNAEQVRAAALAPAQPSSQDRAVAAQASAMAAEARIEQQAEHHGAAETPAHDPSMTIARLQAERRETYGAYDHAHGEGCPQCSRVVSAYRSAALAGR